MRCVPERARLSRRCVSESGVCGVSGRGFRPAGRHDISTPRTPQRCHAQHACACCRVRHHARRRARRTPRPSKTGVPPYAPLKLYAPPARSSLTPQVHTPGIYVNRIVQGSDYERYIERLTLAGEETAGSGITPARERIARRAVR